MKQAFIIVALLLVTVAGLAAAPAILQPQAFKTYTDNFNATDQELYPACITNGAAWPFLSTNIPLLECPDKDIESTYYFRWWTYRKHIKPTPDGFITTEFLPNVPWAGKDNSISCAAGHHFYEGRWLADPKYLNDYATFWFQLGGAPRQYSFWAADSIWARYLVTGDAALPKKLLPDLVKNFQAWETDHRATNGLFWQADGNDGMEMSIGGDGLRPTINSYMYGDALAVSNIAALIGNSALARDYGQKAAQLKQLTESQLWNPDAQFFEVRSRENNRLSGVRELCGYAPWYFNLPTSDKSVAWRQLIDPRGFHAPFGPTTAEQRDPRYAIAYTGHECQWNGPSWPYLTSLVLTAMANLLDNYAQTSVTPRDYFDLLNIYTRSHRLKLDDGRVVPWIDENLDPRNGVWIARTLLRQRGSEIPERGKDYNHSTYCDLIITGLIGLRPRPDATVEVRPLTPAAWDYFCLDNIHYHRHTLTLLYDRTGAHYRHGAGLQILAEGHPIAHSPNLAPLTARLPSP